LPPDNFIGFPTVLANLCNPQPLALKVDDKEFTVGGLVLAVVIKAGGCARAVNPVERFRPVSPFKVYFQLPFFLPFSSPSFGASGAESSVISKVAYIALALNTIIRLCTKLWLWHNYLKSS
jgi:hypothetical protein